jgi:hypothetical protein
MEPTLPELISGALRLDRSAFDAIEQSSQGLRVLFLNRVSPGRFALALVLGDLELVLEALLWITSVWVVVGLLGVSRPHLVETLDVIGLAYAPFLFGVLLFSLMWACRSCGYCGCGWGTVKLTQKCRTGR